MGRDGRLTYPGYCFRCEREVADVMLVRVVERGSGPPAGIGACVAHARDMADEAPHFVGEWLADDLARVGHGESDPYRAERLEHGAADPPTVD